MDRHNPQLKVVRPEDATISEQIIPEQTSTTETPTKKRFSISIVANELLSYCLTFKKSRKDLNGKAFLNVFRNSSCSAKEVQEALYAELKHSNHSKQA